jgi:hypothetical protein
MESIYFDKSIEYNTLKTGVTVLTILTLAELSVDFEAKVDTGASHCFFERKHAERLGIDVESGQELQISTVTGHFFAFGHELSVSTLGI